MSKVKRKHTRNMTLREKEMLILLCRWVQWAYMPTDDAAKYASLDTLCTETERFMEPLGYKD